MSDWNVDRFNFDDWVDDLELVVDAVGLDRFPLLGVSQGWAVAIAFAARHPERVSRLDPCGSYARGRLVRATTDEQRREAALDLEVARIGWGRDDPSFRQMFTLAVPARRHPGAVGGLQRAAAPRRRPATPCASSRRSPASTSRSSPRRPLPDAGRAQRDDRREPFSAARELAALIPGARLVRCRAATILTDNEPAWPVFSARSIRSSAADVLRTAWRSS